MDSIGNPNRKTLRHTVLYMIMDTESMSLVAHTEQLHDHFWNLGKKIHYLISERKMVWAPEMYSVDRACIPLTN